MIGLIVTGAYSVYRIGSDVNKDRLYCLVAAVIAFLSIALMLYILADNEQPIDCEWKCDSYTRNETIARVNCNIRGNSGMRFGFMTLALTLIIASLILLGCDMGAENGVI